MLTLVFVAVFLNFKVGVAGPTCENVKVPMFYLRLDDAPINGVEVFGKVFPPRDVVEEDVAIPLVPKNDYYVHTYNLDNDVLVLTYGHMKNGSGSSLREFNTHAIIRDMRSGLEKTVEFDFEFARGSFFSFSERNSSSVFYCAVKDCFEYDLDVNHFVPSTINLPINVLGKPVFATVEGKPCLTSVFIGDDSGRKPILCLHQNADKSDLEWVPNTDYKVSVNRFSHKSVVFDGFLYSCGGNQANGDPIQNCEKAKDSDFAEITFEPALKSPEFELVVWNNKICAMLFLSPDNPALIDVINQHAGTSVRLKLIFAGEYNDDKIRMIRPCMNADGVHFISIVSTANISTCRLTVIGIISIIVVWMQ